jgi:hypothetical protein
MMIVTFMHNYFFSLSHFGSRADFSVAFLQTVGLLGRVISSSQDLYLNTGQHRHKINTYTHQAPMTTIPASVRAKTVHASERWATVTGYITIITY